MRKFLPSTAAFVASAIELSSLPGCAARRQEARAKLPVADSVCLQIEGVKEPEKGLVLRKAKTFLGERGFRLVESDCDLKIAYTALDQGQWEMMTTSLLGLRSQSAYRVEGMVSIWKRGGEPLDQDQSINIRDYTSKTDILEALAWAVIRYVPDNYRPLVQPRE